MCLYAEQVGAPEAAVRMATGQRTCSVEIDCTAAAGKKRFGCTGIARRALGRSHWRLEAWEVGKNSRCTAAEC